MSHTAGLDEPMQAPSPRKRAIIVGTGGIAGAHGRAYLSDGVEPRAEIVGVVDIEKDRARDFAEQVGISWHGSDYQAALDDIQAAEKASGCYCAVVFQWRYGSGMQHAKSQMDNGTLGRPLVAVCNTLWYRDDAYYSVPWRGKWKTELGGPTMGLGIHMMDSFLWLLGDWEEVTAKVATMARNIEVEDVSMAIVRFKSGAMATIINSVLSPRQETYLRIDCELGTVETKGLYSVENSDWRWTAIPGDARPVPTDGDESASLEDAGDPTVEWSAIPREQPTDHTTHIISVYDDMERNRRPLTSGNEARRTLELLSAIYKSAFTGRRFAPGRSRRATATTNR
jgi:predicted dehydrogenase